MIQENPPILWKAGAEDIQNSRLHQFMQWLQLEKGLHFEDYDPLWEWSIDNLEDFWGSLVEYFDVDLGEQWSGKVLEEAEMPDQNWFPGARVNYARHLFHASSSDRPAVIHKTETRPQQEVSWVELEHQVASFAAFLKSRGVQKGDRVAAYISNIPEATVGLLACLSIGAVWSSCSPDFGVDSVRERFEQIEPKVLLAVDGYSYGGKKFHKVEVVEKIAAAMPSVQSVVHIRLDGSGEQAAGHWDAFEWDELMQKDGGALEFVSVPFDHPMWVLYSSGTTGKPKAITHSQGGMLLEHLKYMAFHNDLREGERFFWYSTTGWMMWNFTQAALLLGGTIVLYDGSPAFPQMDSLWFYAQEARINHFGTSAPYIVACLKEELSPGSDYELSQLRSIGSTGAPLPPEGFEWVYEQIHDDIWLCSMSGGTDVCTAFVGGVFTEPVYLGEIQRPALGCALFAYNDQGTRVEEEVGEMVIERPMPSMPIYFWNDPGKQRYRESYFEHFPGKWRHGDWVYVTSRKTLVILGRSDATLNRQGVRIGTAEIYRAVEQMSEIAGALIVNLELEGGNHYMPLFVKLQEGQELTEELISAIKKNLRTTYSPRHVPDDIIEVPDIPKTISGKKMETPVKKILMGKDVSEVASKDAMQNPDSMEFFKEFSMKIGQR